MKKQSKQSNTLQNPTDLWQRIHRVEIKTRRLVNNILGGQYMSVFKGVGLEFDEVRPYQEGDDERRIDWNVTARSGQLHVKRFVEERELTIMLVVDISPSVYFGSQRQLKTDVATEFCALMAFSAMRNNDRVGLLTFDQERRLFLSPKKGRRHTLRMIRELMHSYETLPPSQPQGTNLTAALDYLNHILHRHAIIFIVSDFMNVGDLFPLKVLSQRHDCIAVCLQDPLDLELPELGLVEIQDPETGQRLIHKFNRKTRDAYRAKSEAHYQELTENLRRIAVDQILLSTQEESVLSALLKFYRFHHVH